jgi:hypothetical protein
MKKLLLSAVAGILLVSCQKGDDAEKKTCWECSINSVTSMAGFEDETITATVEQCDLTESEMKEFETAGTSTTTITSGGIAATIKNTTKCTEKK